MAAVIAIHSYHGPSAGAPTITDITNVEMRHKRADNDTADIGAPMSVPSTSINYGWRKLTRIKVLSGLSPSGSLSNLMWFAATAPPDWAGTVSLFAGITPSFLVVGSAADETQQLATTQDANVYSALTPLTVNTGIVINAVGYGASQNYVLQQIGVWSTATSGVKAGRTCSYRYDEV